MAKEPELRDERAVLRAIGRRLTELRSKIAQCRSNGSAPDYLADLAIDATLAWVAGMSAKRWIQALRVTRAELEYLKDAEIWPSGKHPDLDAILATADRISEMD